ncbi:MAG: hypothetical protein ACK5CA_17235 [Cyanobacteriota bacterium]
MPAAPPPLLQRLSNQFFNLLGQYLTLAWDKLLLGLGALSIETITSSRACSWQKT